ncbi:MAG: hypothetical protein LKM45_03145 [Wolbachia endosymbiont of Alcedoecus sp.]|nr:hypothetical protein [Wolbachia endosymbiont of Alcedoecus sp.]
MPAGLTFFKDTGRTDPASADLSDAKVIVYEDGGGNKYTLDASSVSGLSGVDDIKLSNLLKAEVNFKYHPSGGEEAETQGLGNIISTLFAAKSTSDSKTVLAEEVAKKPVVEAIFDTVDSTNNKKVAEVKLGGIFATKTALETSDVARTILGAKDGKKSILVEELGEALDRVADNANDKVYGTTGNEKVAKDFLVSKGLGSASTDTSAVATKLVTEKATELGTAILGVTKEVDGTQQPALETDLAANKTLQDAVAAVPALKTAVAADQGFRDAVTSTLANPEAIAAVPTLKTDVATQLLTDNNRAALATEIASKAALKEAVTTDTTFKNAVTSTLAKPEDIAAVPALKTAVATDAGLQTAVKTALVGDSTFANAVAVEVNSNDPKFQGSVREVMSQPVFEIPADDNAPLSWDW